jgi:hypothetical protein
MKNEIFKKKKKLFAKCVEEVKVTPKGMYYGITKLETPDYENHVEVYTARSVTKTTLHKIGKVHKQKEKFDCLALKPNGTILLKTTYYPVYTKIDLHVLFTMNRRYGRAKIEKKLAHLIAYGTSFEWMLPFKNLWQFAITSEFSSFKDFKNFLGFDFINERDFLFFILKEDKIDSLLIRLLLENYHKKTPSIVNIIHHESTYISEIISMYKQLELEIHIPKGKNALRKIHNQLVFKLNEKNINEFSDEKIEIKTNFFELLVQKNIHFKILDSPRKMFVQGLQQRHCIASYVEEMHSYLFVTIQHKGEDYDIQIRKKDKVIIQFKGIHNKETPQDLEKEIQDLIAKVNYIEIEDPKRVLEQELPVPFYQDDLPF